MPIKITGKIDKTKGGSPPPVDCKSAWDQIEKETNEILKDPDPIKRNKQISKAYAQLYNEKPQLEWSGLASIVSRQAGCAMQNAKSRTSQWIGGDDAKVAYDALAKGNKTIFEDIYPNMRFYAKYGMEGIRKCGNTEGHSVPDELKAAFDLVEKGKNRKAADAIAEYEQQTVIQDKVYSDPKVKETFQKNQEWANSRLAPIARLFGAQKPEIPLSSECGGGNNVPFVGDINNPKDRVIYYKSLMTEMDKLSKDAKWLPTTLGNIIKQAP
ncbi:MAG TPA: DUF2515 family protein [Myxococcaceae bacterium]|nr:DUF2515 family protein [Myxococcaceae bacterium]